MGVVSFVSNTIVCMRCLGVLLCLVGLGHDLMNGHDFQQVSVYEHQHLDCMIPRSRARMFNNDIHQSPS